MSTITLLTVLQVIQDRIIANTKEVERVYKDKRVKDKTAVTGLFARIDEANKIYNLLKAQLDANTKAAFTAGPIHDPGSNTGQLSVPFSQRTSPDALGKEEEVADWPDLVAKSPNADKQQYAEGFKD